LVNFARLAPLSRRDFNMIAPMMDHDLPYVLQGFVMLSRNQTAISTIPHWSRTVYLLQSWTWHIVQKSRLIFNLNMGSLYVLELLQPGFFKIVT
jgi:hypothetical protein